VAHTPTPRNMLESHADKPDGVRRNGRA